LKAVPPFEVLAPYQITYPQVIDIPSFSFKLIAPTQSSEAQPSSSSIACVPLVCGIAQPSQFFPVF